MAIFNRIYCPQCKAAYNIYKKDEKKKELVCRKCQAVAEIKAENKNYFIEYYFNGKRRREQIGSSKVLAEEAYRKRRTEMKENKFFDIKRQLKISFQDFADEFFRLHCQTNNKSDGRFADAALQPLRIYFSGYNLSEITPLLIDKFKSERIQKVTPATVNRSLTILKSLFNRAIDWGKYHAENPVKKVKFFKENNARTRYLEKEEIVRLLAVCRSHLKPIVIVALNTGMRRGEILSLKWTDCDFKTNVIYLGDTKNGEKREVPMNEQVKTALMRVKKHPQSLFIFYKKDGSQIGDVKKSFFTALKKADIKNFRFHDLRHTFASQLVMSGIDTNTVRELLGQKSMAMALRYSHLSPNHKKQAVDILNRNIINAFSSTNKDLQIENTVPVAQLDRATAFK